MKLWDLHNDYYTSIKFDALKSHYFEKNKKNNIHMATAIWTSEMNADKVISTLESTQKFSDCNKFLAIEDLHFVTKPILNQIINYQPKYCGMTWNNNNNLAGGAYDTGDLTAFGKYVVENVEQNDIFIDTAHLNEQSFISFANITQKPILCSHTACHKLWANARNLKDYQLKIIEESGGLVGLCLVSQFLNGTNHCNFIEYIKHLNYLVNKIGIDHVAIGTDFYGTKHLPKSVNDYDKFLNKLSYALERLGYSENDIEKLYYANIEQFFKL